MEKRRWTAEQVLALAPDAESPGAGARLALPTPWSGSGATATALWGLCAGGGDPYRTAIDITGPGYTCDCPSRESPCEHALGLLLLWSEGPAGPVRPAAEPYWVTDRLGGHRRSTGPDSATRDPGAARRRAGARTERMTAGAAELEQRLTDLLRGGMTQPPDWAGTAARMVDAQAPGLAGRVRELGALTTSGTDWPSRLLEESGLLHLLARAFLRQEHLPEPIAATVRSRAGLTMDKATLLAAGPAVRDDWLVLGQQDSPEGRLTRRRVWLRGRSTGRTALVLSYGTTGGPPGLPLPTGLSVDAELTYYPAAPPLRAALGNRYAATPAAPPPGTPVGRAAAEYGEALCSDPWLEAWPTVLTEVVPVPGAGTWRLADTNGPDALPLTTRSPWRLAALSGGHPLTVFGEYGHRGFTPVTAWAPGSPEAVPL